MRFDKLTTQFQSALADAQSLAVGHDNPYIEPQHLLAALLGQQDASAASLIQRAGGNPLALRNALQEAIGRLPKVEGSGGEVNLSRELGALLNVADKLAQKRGDQFIASEMFLLALMGDKGETGRLLKQAGVTLPALEAAIEQVRGGQTVTGQEDEVIKGLSSMPMDEIFLPLFIPPSIGTNQSHPPSAVHPCSSPSYW